MAWHSVEIGGLVLSFVSATKRNQGSSAHLKSANSNISILFTRLASLRDDRDRREVTYAKNLPQLAGKLIGGNCG